MERPDIVITVVGLGYVGLPLALEFGTKYKTYGYDLDASKLESYDKGIDPANEMDSKKFKEAIGLTFTFSSHYISYSNYIIVCIPTPVDNENKPDLTLLKSATTEIGKKLSKGSIVIYESTVAPGTTREVCVPILEKESGLKYLTDFNVGYSPERINPGDKEHTLTNVIKIVSGDTPETRKKVYNLYESIITAGVFPAASIEVAEAAKIIENIQRDVNIALMNELALLFDKMNIDMKDVLNAARTKWNFLPFEPGLVGGHCIGVDPFYLAHKAKELGFDAKLILSGRHINDSVAIEIANKIKFETSLRSDCQPKDMNIGIFGVTFKNDCADLRNSKVFDLINELRIEGYNLFLCDPIANSKEVSKTYNYELTSYDQLPPLHVIIIAVNHKEYKTANIKYFTSKLVQPLAYGWIYDIKGILNRKQVKDENVGLYWRL